MNHTRKRIASVCSYDHKGPSNYPNSCFAWRMMVWMSGAVWVWGSGGAGRLAHQDERRLRNGHAGIHRDQCVRADPLVVRNAVPGTIGRSAVCSLSESTLIRVLYANPDHVKPGKSILITFFTIKKCRSEGQNTFFKSKVDLRFHCSWSNKANF